MTTATKVRIESKDGRLLALSSYDDRDLMKRVNGARPLWDTSGPRKRFVGWTYPATPGSASNLLAVFSERLDWTDCPQFERLLATASRAADLQRVHDDTYKLDPLPFDVKTKPWRHQLAAWWLASSLPASLLNMGMGTGKTKVVVDLVVGLGLRRVLVVCPKAVVPTWPNEFEKHSRPGEASVVPLKGSVKDKAVQLENLTSVHLGSPRVVVVNYEAVWREPLRKAILKAGFDLVVADEVHRIKSAGSKVSMFFRRLGETDARRIGLSGTPLAHSPLDAYGIFRFLDPGIFGTSLTHFREKYCVMAGYILCGFRNLDEFKARFHSITFTAPRDVLELPPCSHIEHPQEMPAKAQKIYDALESEFTAELESGEVTATNALTRMLRLQQVTSGFAVNDDEEIVALHKGKIESTRQIVEDLPEEEAVVVFARFRRDIDALVDSLSSLGGCSEVSGQANTLSEWKEGATRCVVVQVQSGSEGIDLTRARHCVYYSLDFSLARYEQSLARVHRPGQERETFYHHLITKGTIDEHVYKLLAKRKEVVESIVDRRSLSD